MNKENWRKFKEGELIIHFEEVNDVRDFCGQSKVYLPGEKDLFLLLYTMCDKYGHNSCVRHEHKGENKNLLCYGDVDFYKKNYSYLPIVDWKDFIKQSKTSKTHSVEINGIVISEMDEEKFIDEFITWVENINGKFLGITKEVENN